MMKPERFFYTTAGAIFLGLTIAGFHRYIFGGVHFDGTPIDPTMLATVIAHSTAIFVWFLLFFAQSVLITVKNRRLHMKLGWSVLVVASTIAVTGPLVAIRSTRLYPSDPIFDWPAPGFLLIMLTEIALYVAFVTLGVLYRKQPRIHRAMMLMASLSIISGGTARIGLVNSLFGLHEWAALFGPVVVLGLVLLLVRLALVRSLDRTFAFGMSVLVVVSLLVTKIAWTDAWMNLAGLTLKK